MATRLGKFELPNRLIKEEETATDKFAKFIADPFETGYGHTVGNAFRRVLLSSIEGAAISSIKMDGVQHEFQSVDGVVEDVTDIVLNLKKVLIISHKAESVVITLDVEKEGVVTAGDIAPIEGIEIINPEQIILTTDRKQKVFAELNVTVGRGFCLGEDSKEDNQPIGVINVDALYSPVKLVKYDVLNTRVGQMTDYDKLLLEIHTDGRISPDDALKQSAAILIVKGKATGNSWEDIIMDLRVEDHENPIKELERLINIHKAYDYMNKGDLAMEEGDSQKAEQLYLNAQKLFPSNLEMKYWYAINLLNNKNFDKAKPILQSIFKEDFNWRTLTARLVKSKLLVISDYELEKVMKL